MFAPPAADNRWKEWARPIWDFLCEAPRTWDEVVAFGRQLRDDNLPKGMYCEELVKQCVAWLELMRMAYTSRERVYGFRRPTVT